MRHVAKAALAIAALTAGGCSKSAVELLRSGDPKVCASREVTNDVLTIARQQSSIAGGSILPDAEALKERYLKEVSFAFDQITGTGADKVTNQANCSAELKVSADGVDDRTATVSYIVAADLLNDKPIVTADVTAVTPLIGNIITNAAAPEFAKAQAEKKRIEAEEAAANEAKAAKYESEWWQNHAPFVQAQYRYISSQGFKGRFSEDEMRQYVRSKALAKQCHESANEERDLICPLWYADKTNICEEAGYLQHCNSEGELKEGMNDSELGGANKPTPLPENLENM